MGEAGHDKLVRRGTNDELGRHGLSLRQLDGIGMRGSLSEGSTRSWAREAPAPALDRIRAHYHATANPRERVVPGRALDPVPEVGVCSIRFKTDY